MWGITQRVTMDAALDEISRLRTSRDDALDAITSFMRKHEDHDTDPDLTLARIALQ